MTGDGLVTVLLLALVTISVVVAAMLQAAWHDLGRPHHARTWSAAFALSAGLWALPFACGLGWIGRGALPVMMAALAGFGAALIAIGFRQRAGLAAWQRPLLAGAAAAATLLAGLALVRAPVPWVAPFAGYVAAMLAIAARTLRGRRRGERAAERIAEGGLGLLVLACLLAVAASIGRSAGLVTLPIETLALMALVLLPAGIAGLGLFTMILLTADLADQTRRLAASDRLTGSLNRRGFDAAAQALLAATRRQRRPVALVLIDVDHFKVLNDRFGHPAGDRVLRAICQRIAGAVQRRDVFARLGGEEFALILTDVDRVAATCAVEVLRAAVEATPLALPEPHPITASFGLAFSERGDDPLAELLLRADRALYRAKAEGRNRVSVAA